MRFDKFADKLNMPKCDWDLVWSEPYEGKRVLKVGKYTPTIIRCFRFGKGQRAEQAVSNKCKTDGWQMYAVAVRLKSGKFRKPRANITGNSWDSCNLTLKEKIGIYTDPLPEDGRE